MLFFDDSVWSDHCRIVSTRCLTDPDSATVLQGGQEVAVKGTWGVVSQKTPNGLTLSEWEAGLKKYAQQAEAMAEAAAAAATSS